MDTIDIALDTIDIALSLGFVAFVAFCIFFFFKLLEFVIRAINLYEQMISRQDVMIKLLKDISGSEDHQNDIEDVEAMGKSLPSSQENQLQRGSGHHHWGENDKTYNVVKQCPKCNGIYHGAEFEICGECDCPLVS